MPPGEGVEPYLLSFGWGGTFHARDKHSKDPILLNLFRVSFIFPKARLLVDVDSGTPLRVDPLEFCRRFELYEILFIGREDNEPVNRADTAAGLSNDESPKGVNLLDEEPAGRQV